MIKIVRNFKPTGYKNSLFAIFILLALAWLFFHSELSEPEIHNHADHHFDYCQLVSTVIQSHQPTFYKVELCFIPNFNIGKELITSITDDNHSVSNLPASLPLILITKQLLI